MQAAISNPTSGGGHEAGGDQASAEMDIGCAPGRDSRRPLSRDGRDPAASGGRPGVVCFGPRMSGPSSVTSRASTRVLRRPGTSTLGRAFDDW